MTIMFLYTSVFLFYIVALPCVSSAFVERRLFCSSEHSSIWYSYEGPLYYLSATLSPCFSQEVSQYVMTYTVIPMFTSARFGYHARVYLKGQLWFEYTQPFISCEDVKICYIIKGETLHETCRYYFTRKGLFATLGEFQIYLDVNIVDDAERMLKLHFNITIQIKSIGRKNGIFRQLVGM